MRNAQCAMQGTTWHFRRGFRLNRCLATGNVALKRTERDPKEFLEMAAESIGGMLYGYKTAAKIQPEENDVVWVNKRHDPQDLRSNAPVQRSKFICGPPDMQVALHWRRETQPSLKTFSRHLEEEKWYPTSQATRCQEWSTLRQILPSKGIPQREICPRWGTGMPLSPSFHPITQKHFPHINSPMTR